MEDTEESKLKMLKMPIKPTDEEVHRHNIDHAPYRAWCRACVAGRGKADPHKDQDGEPGQVPTIACDYCFMGEKVEDDKLSDKCLPIIVHKNVSDRWVTSHVVPKKGANAWAVKISAFDLERSGLLPSVKHESMEVFWRSAVISITLSWT